MNLQTQAIINTVGNAIYLFALWLLTVITTKVLGYEAAGVLTLAMAVGNAIVVVQLYGVRGYQSSDMSFRYSPKDYLHARIVTVVAGWFIGIVVCLIMGYPLEISLTVILLILLKTSESFSDALFGNDQRIGHLELAGFSMMARGMLLTLLFIAGAILYNNLNIALGLSAAGVLALSLFVDLPVHNMKMRQVETVSDKGFVGVLKDCFPLLITTLIPTIITAFPRIILERYYGAETLGFYGNVSTPALVLTTVMPTILYALLPGYGIAYEEKNYHKIRNTWAKSIVGTVGFTAICVIGVIIMGKPVLAFVYTNEITPYVRYLYFVLVAMMLYTLTMCNNTVLVAMRKNWGMTLTAILSLALCLAVSVPIVRSFGIAGAIMALIISYGAQMIIQIVWVLLICRKGLKE